MSFPLLSGGKGVHVVVPLRPEAEWPAVKDFADRFARAMAGAEPDRFVAVMAKAKRKGRIFIDWLRNQRGATAIMPYSARARSGAPVAVPVSWTELRDIDTAARWSRARRRGAGGARERAVAGGLGRGGPGAAGFVINLFPRERGGPGAPSVALRNPGPPLSRGNRRGRKSAVNHRPAR